MLKFIAFSMLLATFATATPVTPVPESMGALGDSMSAGVLTPYRRQNAMNPLYGFRIVWNSLNMMITGDREALAFRENSWSTGYNVYSHYLRLVKLNPDIKYMNLSVPTANSKDVWQKQIPAMIKISQKNLKQNLPDYVTLLIGHIDLCGSSVNQLTTVEEFQFNIHKSIEMLMSTRNETRVLVSPMAQIIKLPEVVGNSFLVPSPGMNKCRDVWKTIPLCRTVTQRDSKEDQLAVEKRYYDFNRIIKSEVKLAREQYGDRIRFADRMENYVPQPNDVSIDCFHANKDAQVKISKETWKSTWWSN